MDTCIKTDHHKQKLECRRDKAYKTSEGQWTRALRYDFDVSPSEQTTEKKYVIRDDIRDSPVLRVWHTKPHHPRVYGIPVLGPNGQWFFETTTRHPVVPPRIVPINNLIPLQDDDDDENSAPAARQTLDDL